MSHSLENSPWERLGTCHKTYYGMNEHDLTKTNLIMSRFSVSGRRGSGVSGVSTGVFKLSLHHSFISDAIRF